jgi:hypothetical protein
MSVKKDLTKRLVSLVIGAYISLSAVGCFNNSSVKRYSLDKPLIVVSDGLFSIEARRFFSDFCNKRRIPYVGEDNVCWFNNKDYIEKANKQGREIVLIGYSSGCDQVRITAEWCDKKGIDVHSVFFDPTYLCFTSNKLPDNVKSLKNYLSERNIPDIVEVGKGRRLNAGDFEDYCPYQNIELKGTHLQIFNKNKIRIERGIEQYLKSLK